jgi:hypothetical protein
MSSIIAEVFDEAEKRIQKRLVACNTLIQDFSKPLNIPLDDTEKHKYFEERLSDRLSTANLRKTYEEKSSLEIQLRDIVNFRFMHKEYFENGKGA